MHQVVKIALVCVLVGQAAAQFAQLSAEKPGDAGSQRVADMVKDQLEVKLGAGHVTLNKVIRYRTRAVDMQAPGGGLTFGMVYYMKIETSSGKYVHASVSTGPSGPKLGMVEKGKRLSDPL